MASQYDIVVHVDASRAQRGIRQVDQGMRRAEAGANRLGRALTRAFGAISGAFAGRAFVRMADTMTNLQNRLRTVTSSATELAEVQERLYRIAQDTRAPLEATTELYARMATSAEELGLSQERLLGITRTLNQAVALSGATATEGANAIRQLAQGMSAGALRGEELNSVLENLPSVADLIAEHLGVTRGRLRELAEQGRLTTGVLVEAFERAADGVERDFGGSVTTVEGSLTRLRNSFLRLVGEINDSTGGTTSLARAINLLADNLGRVADVAFVAGGALLFAFGGLALLSAVGRLAGALLSVGGALLSAGSVALTLTGVLRGLATVAGGVLTFAFKVLLGVVGTLASAAVFMGDRVRIAGTSFATLRDVAEVLWERLTALIGGASDALSSFLGLTERAPGSMEETLGGAIAGMAVLLDGFLTALRRMAAAIPNFFIAALNTTAQAVDAVVNGVINKINGLILRFNELVPESMRVGTFAPKSVGSVEPFSADESTFFRDVIRDAEWKAMLRRVRRTRDPASWETTVSRADRVTPTPSGGTGRGGAVEESALQRANRELDRQLELLGMGRDEQERRLRLWDVEDEMRRAGLALGEREKALLEERIRGVQALTNTVQAATDAMEATFNHIGDAFVDFAMTGKTSFKDMADSIIRDLLRIAMQAFVIKPLLEFGQGAVGSLLGGGGSIGSIVGGIFGSLLGFEHGGQFVVGGAGGVDSQVVAFRATPGEHVSIAPPGRPHQQATVVVQNPITITNHTGSPVETRQTQGPGGVTMTEKIVGEVRGAMARGELDGVLSARHGLGPQTKRR